MSEHWSIKQNYVYTFSSRRLLSVNSESIHSAQHIFYSWSTTVSRVVISFSQQQPFISYTSWLMFIPVESGMLKLRFTFLLKFNQLVVISHRLFRIFVFLLARSSPYTNRESGSSIKSGADDTQQYKFQAMMGCRWNCLQNISCRIEFLGQEPPIEEGDFARVNSMGTSRWKSIEKISNFLNFQDSSASELARMIKRLISKEYLRLPIIIINWLFTETQ